MVRQLAVLPTAAGVLTQASIELGGLVAKCGSQSVQRLAELVCNAAGAQSLAEGAVCDVLGARADAGVSAAAARLRTALAEGWDSDDAVANMELLNAMRGLAGALVPAFREAVANNVRLLLKGTPQGREPGLRDTVAAFTAIVALRLAILRRMTRKLGRSLDSGCGSGGGTSA
ncbi:MAG: hypothetical protein IPM64_06230 [Phycisphaerales bacterium]|nr:hypothetical protein [Phycisphaerales bacterium]